VQQQAKNKQKQDIVPT